MGESRDVPGPELCALTCKSYRDASYTFTRNYLCNVVRLLRSSVKVFSDKLELGVVKSPAPRPIAAVQVGIFHYQISRM